jgi:hypothetical protein
LCCFDVATFSPDLRVSLALSHGGDHLGLRTHAKSSETDDLLAIKPGRERDNLAATVIGAALPNPHLPHGRRRSSLADSDIAWRPK